MGHPVNARTLARRAAQAARWMWQHRPRDNSRLTTVSENGRAYRDPDALAVLAVAFTALTVAALLGRLAA